MNTRIAGRTPKRGDTWARRSGDTNEGALIHILAVVNPMGDTPPYVVVEHARELVTVVRLDRFHDDYECVSINDAPGYSPDDDTE